jgi:6,7-dimethyl-8-ribityllumazine synthase
MADPQGEERSFSEDQREALSKLEFAICRATFYTDLADRLQAAAIEAFNEGGVSPASVQTFDVPGAFELPFAAKLCADSGRFAGIACIGAVIRGETTHYDYVCGEAARGIQDVQLQTGVPVTFGVLTVENMDQALARAGGDKRDQGRNAALAVMGSALLAKDLAA